MTLDEIVRGWSLDSGCRFAIEEYVRFAQETAVAEALASTAVGAANLSLTMEREAVAKEREASACRLEAEAESSIYSPREKRLLQIAAALVRTRSTK